MVIIGANGRRTRQTRKTRKVKKKRTVRPKSSTKMIKRRRTCARPRAVNKWRNDLVAIWAYARSTGMVTKSTR